MKLQNENKYLLLLFFCLLTTPLVYSKLAHKDLLEISLQGKWQYVSIDKGGQSIAKFSEADTMIITSLKPSFGDSFCQHTSRSRRSINKTKLRFSYKIPTIKKDAFGLVDLISVPLDSSKYGIAFKFRYSNKSISSSSQTRIFNIENLEDTLVIREGALYFRYIKIHSN